MSKQHCPAFKQHAMFSAPTPAALGFMNPDSDRRQLINNADFKTVQGKSLMEVL
jgi:hypothetical protein